MSIVLNKDFIKEVKKELRNKNNAFVGVYIRIDFVNNLIMFKFDRYNNSKYATENKTEIILEDKIDITRNMNIKYIHLHNIQYNDVFLDVLLSENVYIEPYKKNIKNLMNNENGTENYMSTIIIKNGKKSATYSTICNSYCDMIID